MKLVWSQTMNTGIEKVDRQHRRLVDIVNGIYDAMNRGKTIKELGPSLKELAAYTQTHFSDEQKLMQEINWDGFKAHQALHSDLTKQVKDVFTRLEKGEELDGAELVTFLKDWLVKHILNEDKKFGKAYLAAKDKVAVS